jgi:hypothetical protein
MSHSEAGICCATGGLRAARLRQGLRHAAVAASLALPLCAWSQAAPPAPALRPMPFTLLAPPSHKHTHTLAPHEFRGAPPDLVLWSELEKVGIDLDKASGRIKADFLPAVLRLEGKTVTLVGYMNIPEAGKSYRQFLLSDQPFLCDTCHATPSARGIVEVNLREAIAGKSTANIVTIMVRGKLRLLRNSERGLIYRLERTTVVDRNVG